MARGRASASSASSRARPSRCGTSCRVGATIRTGRHSWGTSSPRARNRRIQGRPRRVEQGVQLGREPRVEPSLALGRQLDQAECHQLDARLRDPVHRRVEEDGHLIIGHRAELAAQQARGLIQPMRQPGDRRIDQVASGRQPVHPGDDHALGIRLLRTHQHHRPLEVRRPALGRLQRTGRSDRPGPRPSAPRPAAALRDGPVPGPWSLVLGPLCRVPSPSLLSSALVFRVPVASPALA